jgi:predicted RNA-binding Zn-ribbon protein involved in translation (DUF1610 family)
MAFSVTCTNCNEEIEDAVAAGWCPECGQDVIKSIEIV